MHSTEEKLKAFERLLEIMDELREKCPWDREQTLDSLRNLTIEEDNERRKIVESLQSGTMLPQTYNTYEDPYAFYCDI